VAALQQLFAGPTESEAAQGYVSPFSEATADLLVSVRVEGRTAFVDLSDVFLATQAKDDCSREAFLSAVERTLKETLPVEWVVYSIEGDVMAFCQWRAWCR
jgi:spore germination protein GerM